MRIKVKFSPTNIELPINNQDLVNSFIHRVLGKDNKYHDAKNNYSISSLQGGTWIKDSNNISLKKGGYITISSLDDEFIDKILMNLYITPFHQNIKVIGIDFIDEKLYNGWNHFVTLSPFIIKKYEDKHKYTFLTVDEENFESKVETYLINKISKINPNLDLSDFKIEIKNNKNHKSKKVLVKNVINKANLCHISIFTNKKVANLLYNIGIGQSTGSGFGTIYKTENHNIYK
jgi:CRISPR-associated endoribonuclease Cas6